MQFLRLLAPAALVALASAQYYDDEQFDILARDAAPGYDDLGFFIRDVDQDNFYNLKTREAEAEELLYSDDTEITLSAREADPFGDYDIVALEEREAEADAEPIPEPKKKKKKAKKCKKGKKGKKCRKAKAKAKKAKKGKGKNKKQTKAQKKKVAAAKKQAKKDDDIFG